jgi:hypothetical protein
MVITISLIIGVMFALCGTAYKIGSFGNVYPIQSATVLSIFGMIFFGIKACATWGNITLWMVFAGLLFGVTQYLAIRLIRVALTLGPLSPAWCASSLTFVPVIVYAGIFMGEKLSILQYFSLAATFGAILAGALVHDGGKHGLKLKNKIIYGILLFFILASGSILNIGLKFCSAFIEPGTQVNMLQNGGNVIMFFTYLFLGLSSAIDLTISKSWRWNKFAYWGGALLSIGAVGGFALSLAIIEAPAVFVFALSNSASILITTLISIFFMHEKRTISWYFTVGFSLLAILLNR